MRFITTQILVLLVALLTSCTVINFSCKTAEQYYTSLPCKNDKITYSFYISNDKSITEKNELVTKFIDRNYRSVIIGCNATSSGHYQSACGVNQFFWEYSMNEKVRVNVTHNVTFLIEDNGIMVNITDFNINWDVNQTSVYGSNTTSVNKSMENFLESRVENKRKFLLTQFLPAMEQYKKNLILSLS